jgi:hypothetical protein
LLTNGIPPKKNPFKVTYGEGAVEGNIAIDRLCFDEESAICIRQFEFLSVSTAEEIEGD